MNRKELRCGTFADVPPFAAPDKQTREMVGHDVDLCKAIAAKLGVTAKITPLSVEARVPEVRLGRVDITVANLAYTLGRAEQIQFSDPYYLAKEMLAVKASDPALPRPTSRASASPRQRLYLGALDQDERLRAAHLPGHGLRLHGRPAGQGARHRRQHDDDHQARQRLADAWRADEDDSGADGVPADRHRHEEGRAPALLAKINETLRDLETSGTLNQIWNKWLGPDTEFKMTRNDKVTPLSQLKFEPLP